MGWRQAGDAHRGGRHRELGQDRDLAEQGPHRRLRGGVREGEDWEHDVNVLMSLTLVFRLKAPLTACFPPESLISPTQSSFSRLTSVVLWPSPSQVRRTSTESQWLHSTSQLTTSPTLVCAQTTNATTTTSPVEFRWLQSSNTIVMLCNRGIQIHRGPYY